MVEGYGRTTCKYCEDKEHDYKPYEWTDGTSFVVNGSRQIKTPKVSKE
jgi:hypothetical protein